MQEAHDLALIAQAATLESRVPFLHFFDGFRTSHELNKLTLIPDDDIRKMIRDDLVRAHRGRGLTPERPVMRGTAQNPEHVLSGARNRQSILCSHAENCRTGDEPFCRDHRPTLPPVRI
ncbi:MAG: hypothetical protein WDN50_12990 [Bradyrhizobium sp.]